MWARRRRYFVRFAPAVFLACGIMALLAFELWRSYQDGRQEAERNVENLVRVLSEQTERTIQSIDLNLQGIAAELMAAPDLADNDPGFLDGLRKRLSSLPYARALFVIDADGFISHDTDYPTTPRVSLADRDYFIAHRDDPSLGLSIGHPLLSRSVGVWFVSLSRRIEHADGSFAGIVVAAMEPLYFEQFYRQLWVGSGAISLFHRDGTLLARSPRREETLGTSFAAAEPFAGLLADTSQAVFWNTSPIDGVRRVAGYQSLIDFPLVMLVAMNETDVMQPWRSHALVITIGAAILLAMIGVMEWVSRRNRRWEERARARLMEAERLESVGRFAGGVAHDVGNLLRVVRSAVLLLRPSIADRSQAQGLLDQIEDTLTVGGELVNQLLFYARTGESRLRPADLNELVSEARPMLERAAGPRVDMRVSLAGSEILCLTDPAQFQAVLVNLVLNGRDAMPDGGSIAINVRSLVDEAGEWGEVSVSDNGAGMSDEVLKRAFDPFFTTKEDGSGCGLGLSQVRTFVQYCKGALEIESEAGKGTVIRLRLPAIAKTEL